MEQKVSKFTGKNDLEILSLINVRVRRQVEITPSDGLTPGLSRYEVVKHVVPIVSQLPGYFTPAFTEINLDCPCCLSLC